MPFSMSQLQWAVAVLWKGLCVFSGQDEGCGDKGFVWVDDCVGLVAIFERRNRSAVLVGDDLGPFGIASPASANLIQIADSRRVPPVGGGWSQGTDSSVARV